MKEFKVYGSGCSKCEATVRLIDEIAAERGVPVLLRRVESMERIIREGIERTPTVFVDGVKVHAGGMPEREAVEAWFGPAES